MKNKIFLLFLLCFLLTGCKTTYDKLVKDSKHVTFCNIAIGNNIGNFSISFHYNNLSDKTYATTMMIDGTFTEQELEQFKETGKDILKEYECTEKKINDKIEFSCVRMSIGLKNSDTVKEAIKEQQESNWTCIKTK